jgi:hypothetical protein
MNMDNQSILGTYRGHFTYTNNKGARHQFEFEIDNLDGVNFHGTGTDGIGDFVVFGTYELDRLSFKKKYNLPEHAVVNYTGDFSIDGQTITGDWWLPDIGGNWEARLIAFKKRPNRNPSGQPKELPVTQEPQYPAGIVEQIQPFAAVPEPNMSNSPNPDVPRASTSPEKGARCANCDTARGDFNFCTNCGHAFDLS